MSDLDKAPDYVDVHVGAKVRTLRNLAGLSQQDLADVCGISFQQIQKYERGANRISASMMVRIAKKLGVPITALFEGLADGPPDKAPNADPTIVAAGMVYEESRRLRRARPHWSDLDMADPFDNAAFHAAVALAKAKAEPKAA